MADITVLGPNGERMFKSDSDLKNQEAFLKAKALAVAEKHGAIKPVFRGMVNGEATYGDWMDGLSDDAINAVMTAANSAYSPEQRQKNLASLGITTKAAPPVYTQQQEQILEKMSPPHTDAPSVSKKIFGF